MSDQSAGQEGPTPDFIPGWFAPREGNPNPAVREAVRIPETGDYFPITFLRSSEMVHNPRRPQLGFCIGNSRHSEMELAVPPGYWIVRDSDGDLANWRDEDFKAKYSRSDRDWTPPVERDVPSGRPAAAERHRHGAESVEATIVSSPDPSLVGRTGRVPLEALGGWEGTPPAQGTRRALIRDAIASKIKGFGPEGEYRDLDELSRDLDELSLELADAIESALLRSTIDAEAMDRAAEALTGGIENVVLEEGEGPPSGLRYSERQMWRRGDGDLRLVLDRIARIRLGLLNDHRDDEWVQEVVMRAITAGQEHDAPFPADVVDAVLREFGIRPILPRKWPSRGEAAISKVDAPEAADDSPGGDDPAATIKFLEGEVERFLREREEARSGEDHWKAQRDAAFRLLQWVLPDLMGHPSDTLGADLADDAPAEDREDAPGAPDNFGLSEQARAALAARIEEGRIDPDDLIEIARLG